jgi:hypothetical protein
VNLNDAPTDTVTYDRGRVSLRQIADDVFTGTQTYKKWARKAAALGVDIHGMLGLATVPGGQANGDTSLGQQSTAQLDHWRYTGDQLMGHELGHQIRFKLPEAYTQARAAVLGSMSALEYEELKTDYNGQFGEAYKVAGYSDREVADILIEEILCDAYGQMDRGETEASKYHDIVAPIFDAALEARAQELGIGAETATDVAESKYSISSIFRAVGFDNISLEGGRVIVRDQNGDIIRNVTRENVEQSYLGQMIRYAQNQTKTISAKDAGKQIQGIKDLLNLMIHAQDGDLVWKFAGATMFSAVRSNSDAQYSTTIDFSTVCRKTKDMMETLSSTMKKLDRGLSRDEVVRLQKNIIEEHGQVPCPVCYVFSRWAGVGGILQNMADFQEKYDGAEWDDPANVQARIDELRAATRTKKDLRAYLQQQDDEYMALSAAQEQAQAEIRQLKKDRTALNRIKDKTEVELQQIQQINEAIESLQNEVDRLKSDLKEIEDKGAPEAAWLERVRIKPDYREHGYVSHDVLYDLVNADRMAAEAPLAWSYRTTRGPAAGKAILPYSDYRLGDLIMGPKAAPGQTLFQNEGNTGALTEDQLKAINAAIRKTKAQNLIGGQRYQSTSDFRYDYGLDYLLSFFEGQALGMKLQCYTKVVEFAEIVASLGGDVNLSVMPFGKGYQTVTLPDGRTVNQLVYSSVTGMNPDAAIKASQMYDNAQLILVGINDEHILAALEDSPETGGAYVGFVIPYHASGASVNNFIRGLVEHLGESFNVEYYRDYSPVQNDVEKKNRTKEQEQRAELRRHLLTGRSGGKNWAPSEADLELLRGQNADITGRSFDDLRAVELAALNGDKAAIKEYLSWSAGVLRDVYLKMWADQTAEDTYDVRLTNSQAEHIMPHEYWNPDTTRQNAYVNGFIFRSYCYSLGLTPRFARSVKGADGAYYGDLSGSPGYWKTLIDRPMYANDGSYRPQQAINVTNLSESFSEKDAGMLAPEYAERNWTGFTVPDSPADISERASERFIREQSASRYSMEEPTETDKAFVERFNEFQTQRASRGGWWTGKEFDSFFAAHPEYDFVQRFYTNDKAVKTDLQRFLSTIEDHKLLDQMSWYTTQSHRDKAYRGSVTKVRNQYKARINQLAAEQTNGREIKLVNRYYRLSEIRELFDELNSNDDIRALADKVFARAEQIQPNIYASNQVLGGYNSHRSGASVGRDVWLRSKTFADRAITDQYKASVILHELIHTCTTYAMQDSYRFDGNADPEIQRAANTLHRLYGQAQNEPSLRGEYGVTSPNEFVAELSNPTFREKLEKINLWDRILNAIKGFFGITSKSNMLDSASRALDYMLTDYDYNGAQRYYYGQEKAMQRYEYEHGVSRYSMADEAASVTEAQQKNADYNASKTNVGSTLKTLQGSLIKRYRDNVGKDVGGQIYVHKNYADEIVPTDTLAKAELILQTQYPDFQYNTIMYDRKKGTVRFDEAPDFDTAREPIPGNYVIVDPVTGQTKTGYSDYIWHHKWQWVKNDYKGFNVADSWNWSKQWLSVLRPTEDKVSNRGIANGSGHGTANWNQQLEYFGLPTDTAESRYSITDRTNGTDREGNEYEFVDMPQYQDHTSAGTSLPNNAPSVYKGIQWKSGTRNLDIGGGQTEFANDYLRSQGVENRILDPYNRDADYNLAAIQSLMEDGKYDTVTCANVLNVIDSAQSRRNVILEAAKALQPDGTAYFQIYEGQQGQAQGETKKGWQEARKTATYIDEVKQWFDSVEQYKFDTKTGELKPSKSGNILVATEPKANLPRAYWEYEEGSAVRYSIETVDGRDMPVLNTETANPEETDTRFSISDDLRSWADLQATYGVQQEPPGSVRPTEVPRRTAPGNKVSETVPTVMGAAATPESRLNTIRSAVVGGKLDHIPVENKVTERKAERKVERDGWADSVRKWMNAVDAGRANADLVATGAVLLNNAGNSDATGEEYADIMVHYATLLRNSAQATQAANILKKMSPAARLYEAQKYVNQLNEKLGAKYNEETGEWDGIKIDPSLIKEYNNAQTDAERDALLDLIAQNVADQIRAKPIDWWTAIRYLNMLGNVRTQFRNVLGNAAFQPVRMFKDSLAGLTEALLQKAGVNIERTTSVARDAETWKAAGELFQQFQQAILAGGKYNDLPGADFARTVDEAKRVFNNTGATAWDKSLGWALEKYRRLTNKAMDKGDAIFCSFTFRDSLARFMAANHTTWSEADEAMRSRAIDKAIRDAAEATYRDNNAIATTLSRFARSETTPKFFKWLAEGVLPFRKTPANIALRAYEYSPLSILENTIKTIQSTKKGSNITGNEIINRWAKTFTGTGLAVLGYALAALGHLIGAAPKDDKEKTLFEQMGNQKYALVLGNTTFTIDWAAPEVIPLFLGANIAQTALEQGATLKDGLAAVMQIADPLVEMSMLQGINDALENASTYGTDSAIMTFITNALWGYASQGATNTLIGQAVRAFGENANTRMMTYVDKNSDIPTGVQRAVGKTSAKIPVWDYNQIPYIDAWGDPQENASSKAWNAVIQLFSPAYVSEKQSNAVLDEVQRLYDATGDRSVILDNADKYFTYQRETYNLNAEEYLTYAITRGQTAKACIASLLSGSGTAAQIYSSLDDDQKAVMIKRIYDLANQLGKQAAVGYEPDKWVTSAVAAEEFGVSPAAYAMLSKMTSTESKDLQKMQMLYSQPGLSEAQVQGIAGLLGIGKTTVNLTGAEVQQRIDALPTPEEVAQQEARNDALTASLQKTQLWQDATPAQQDSIQRKIGELTSGTVNGQRSQAKIDEGAQYGLDETEYMLFKLSLQIADANGNNNGNYSNAEVEAAIRAIPNLSTAERDYLWIAQGKSPKSTPNW